MYEKHFNFSAAPFTIAPNPQYLYLTERHREALAHLTYGLNENGGFILLTGEVGTGKTTVCRCLLERVPDNVDVAMVLTPALGVNELLEAICDEFQVKHAADANAKELTDALNRYLLDSHAKGRHAVVIIDEAQNLSVEVLEQLRLLTNLETNEQKLLQIILIGQPEFLGMLEQPALRQLSQRIIARFHLTPLKTEEVRAYIAHRLKVAGGNAAIFPRAVALRIAQLSKGVPRVINLLCDRALLGCYVEDKHQVEMKTLERAAKEVFGDRRLRRRQRRLARAPSRVSPFLARWWPAPAAVAAAAAIFVAYSWMPTPLALFQQVEDGEAARISGGESGGAARPPSAVASIPAAESFAAAPSVAQPPLTWETLMQAEHGEAEAYRALFRRWQLREAPDDDGRMGRTPCGFAARNRLDCWHERGDFRALQRLNRPVLLKLVSEDGGLFYAALLEINGNRLRFGLGDREMEVSRGELERRWTEEFTVLWRRPPGFVRTLRPGDKSDFTAWVEERLFRFEGRKVSNRRSLVYDFALANRVRALQRRCGLRVDGLVGRRTIIALNGLSEEVPMLSKNLNRRCARRLNV